MEILTLRAVMAMITLLEEKDPMTSLEAMVTM